MNAISLEARRAQRTARQLALDVADVATEVSRRASPREPAHLVFILDCDDATARELLTTYAPPQLWLARSALDGVEIVALSRPDGLQLLHAPKHHPTIFREIAKEIASEESPRLHCLCISGRGFQRFIMREAS